MTAVAFDLDGVLLDSEATWDRARRAVVADHGATWAPDATRTMMGMSAPEWSAYLHDRLGVGVPPAAIADAVVARVMASYRDRMPLVSGAVDVVRSFAARWPLALASSSNRAVIEQFLDGSGLRASFTVTVASEEVARGKPAPDVYLAAFRELGVAPPAGVAVEDSTNGIRAARAAGTRVVAIPNREFPPDAAVLASADAVVDRLDQLTPGAVSALTAR